MHRAADARFFDPVAKGARMAFQDRGAPRTVPRFSDRSLGELSGNARLSYSCRPVPAAQQLWLPHFALACQ